MLGKDSDWDYIVFSSNLDGNFNTDRTNLISALESMFESGLVKSFKKPFARNNCWSITAWVLDKTTKALHKVDICLYKNPKAFGQAKQNSDRVEAALLQQCHIVADFFNEDVEKIFQGTAQKMKIHKT